MSRRIVKALRASVIVLSMLSVATAHAEEPILKSPDPKSVVWDGVLQLADEALPKSSIWHLPFWGFDASEANADVASGVPPHEVLGGYLAQIPLNTAAIAAARAAWPLMRCGGAVFICGAMSIGYLGLTSDVGEQLGRAAIRALDKMGKDALDRITADQTPPDETTGKSDLVDADVPQKEGLPNSTPEQPQPVSSQAVSMEWKLAAGNSFGFVDIFSSSEAGQKRIGQVQLKCFDNDHLRYGFVGVGASNLAISNSLADPGVQELPISLDASGFASLQASVTISKLILASLKVLDQGYNAEDYIIPVYGVSGNATAGFSILGFSGVREKMLANCQQTPASDTPVSSNFNRLSPTEYRALLRSLAPKSAECTEPIPERKATCTLRTASQSYFRVTYETNGKIGLLTLDAHMRVEWQHPDYLATQSAWFQAAAKLGLSQDQINSCLKARGSKIKLPNFRFDCQGSTNPYLGSNLVGTLINRPDF